MFNKWRGKAVGAVLVITVSILSWISPALAVSANDIQNATDRVLSYYSQQASCNDWETLGLRWVGAKMAPHLASANATKASDYARKLLGQIAAGESNTNIETSIAALQGLQGVNGDFNTPDNNTLNQTIWSVIALNCAAANGFNVTYDRVKAAQYIADNQDASGGFDESGWGVDVDSTAQTLIALAPYQANYSVKMNQALAYLRNQQAASGGFQSWGSVSPDSTAAVIEALIALGYDPQNPPGAGWQGNMVEALLSYQVTSGGFSNPVDPNKADSYTTRNVLLALGDLINGKSKYQNPMPRGLFISLTKSTPRLDSDATITALVRNTGNESQEFLLIAGVYDTALERMHVYSAMSQSIKGNSELELTYGLDLPASGSYQLRVYAWDNWTNRTPLASPAIISLP